MDRVDQWHQCRWSRYTASEAYKLLVPGKGEMFGVGAMTHIKQKALEMTTRMQQRPELEEVASLLHGKAHEYPAFCEYVRQTRNTELTYLGDENPMFYPYRPLAAEAGGTPDVVNIVEVVDNGVAQVRVDFGVEIKCPKNSMYHFDRLKWKDQFDLKDNYILCYTQIQMLMMITGALEWHFVSYDDRQISKAHQIKIIEVRPDKNFVNNLDVRLRCAIKRKYEIISEHYGLQVVDRADFNLKFNKAA